MSNFEAAEHDPNRKTQKDYSESDVEHVFRQGSFSRWDDVIGWLKSSGMNDNELTPGETEHMVQDFERCANEGKPFTKDPERVFEMAQGHPGRQ